MTTRTTTGTVTTQGETPDDEPAGVGPLDLLLTDGALGPLRRLVPGTAALHLVTGLASRPGRVAGRGKALAAELARVAAGRSDLAAHPKDRRFADDAWSQNPLLRRSLQAYLATSATVEALVDDADLEWQDGERVSFIVDNVVQALSPSNNAVTSPEAWHATLQTGGGNVVSGLRRLVGDLSSSPRVPSMVEPDAFEVGKDLAVTPGAVVLRTEQFELIQYTPTTPKVRTVPLLIVPPTINKYYVVDLAEQRSMVEHFVAGGQQVFVMSWRNPDVRHADWGLDTYGGAVVTALEATRKICATDSTMVLGVCAGGIIASMAVAHLAHAGGLHRIAGLALAVTVLDQERAGTTSALLDADVAKAAAAVSASKGYLDGRTLAEVFAWLRPNDLIWSYWANNYLQGRAPRPFDILFWNADPVRLTAGLHRDFLDLAVSNALVEPGAATMLGSPVDLTSVDVDSYVVAGIADHLCQWQSCYRSTQLLGGRSRFVLSTSGHIASMVNPPGNPKATFRTTDPGDTPADPDEWLARATTDQGSWWPDYLAWLGARSGPEKNRPRKLGRGALRAMEPAPGTYVHDR